MPNLRARQPPRLLAPPEGAVTYGTTALAGAKRRRGGDDADQVR